VSRGGLTGGDARRVHDYLGGGASSLGAEAGKAMAYALAVSEVNAAMGRIVATPTAGSCGVIPGVFVSAQERFGWPDDEMVYGLFCAGAIGYVIANNSFISGAEGGCQAEIGSAVAMAAGALTELRGGNLIAQIANASAYRTAGVDPREDRAARLRELVVRHVYTDPADLERELAAVTGASGADAVLLCAGGPGEPLINRAMAWLRDRGKIVIVGDLSMSFSRAAMFAKEAQVLISRAGGPGRYDAGYERDNRDYPIGYVRWTEGRNVGEFVRLLAEKRVSVAPLITHEVPLERAPEAYALYRQGAPGVIGTVLRHGSTA